MIEDPNATQAVPSDGIASTARTGGAAEFTVEVTGKDESTVPGEGSPGEMRADELDAFDVLRAAEFGAVEAANVKAASWGDEESCHRAQEALSEVENLLLVKMREVIEETPMVGARWLLEPLVDPEKNAEGRRDFLATRLMEVFRLHQSRAAFGLLYELYSTHLLTQVASRLRRYQSKADPNDVLQEVYVNIYRYPHRFDASRDDAFRLWTSTIVRNTVLKHLRSLSRSGRAEVGIDDLPEPPEPRGDGPLQGVLQSESSQECARVYLTYLHLYLQFYSLLSEREQRAIHLVEVDELSYREAAGELEIKLENLKMVIFRARRKIHRSMRRVFEGLPPDVRPARAPRPQNGAASTKSRSSSSRAKVGAGAKLGRRSSRSGQQGPHATEQQGPVSAEDVSR